MHKSEWTGVIVRPGGEFTHAMRGTVDERRGYLHAACGRWYWPENVSIVPPGTEPVHCRRCAAIVLAALGWTPALNSRRCELINRDIGRGDLSDAELAELDRLQEAVARAVDAVYPLPSSGLEEFEAMVAGLRARAAEKAGMTGGEGE